MEIRIDRKFYKGPPEGFDNYCRRTYGSPTAKLIAMRIGQVRAANSLAVLLKGGFPGRWHWLSGPRRHQISADLKDLKRLIFIPVEEVEEFFDSVLGHLDNKKVLGLILIEVADTHNE
jgi:hypothetical protein